MPIQANNASQTRFGANTRVRVTLLSPSIEVATGVPSSVWCQLSNTTCSCLHNSVQEWHRNLALAPIERESSHQIQ